MKHTWHVRQVLAAGAFAVIASASTPSVAEESVPSCISWSASTRYRGIGYDHLVTLTSRCEPVVDCEIWTNVNPDKQRAEVPPGETVEVVTFVASPASEFQAHVACVLRSKK